MNPDPARSRRPTPIVELGVAEAYDLLSRHFGLVDLPPLEAIENEDWGRDSLLHRFLDIPPAELAAAGLCWDDDAGNEAGRGGTIPQAH
ncbi:hypothetical protein TsocGM_15460 [Tautonia sociabilis]|uniref:Uncharacterized protein n=1 Tax=Tautonia sociabilis TaxID=2080755 RepID=A0A432MI11_9BACT|nr:hypothetical protein TsocGM_15460 [Tautonia sociabilis]